MEYTENYEVNFADRGTRSPITDDMWEQGWKEIVGGVNGYPTSAQFNEVCGRLDRKINEVKQKKPDSDGEAKDLFATFTIAQERENINSGESFSTIFGKIKKWFQDLGSAAFAAVANNDSTNQAGYVADARIVKTHGDEIDNLRRDIDQVSQSFQDGCNTIMAGCTSYGATPDSNSPEDIVEAIGEIYNNRYNQGYNDGHSDGYDEGYDAGKVTLKYLGNSTTIDVRSQLPNDYSGLTKDNFFVEVSSISVNGGAVDVTADYPQQGNISASASMSKSYDASTGKLTIGGLSCSNTSWNGDHTWYRYVNGTVSIRVYVAY